MNLSASRPGKLISTLCSLFLAAAFHAGAAETAPVTVEIVGGGTVKPNYNGQALAIGGKYSMTAKPRPGFKFTGWSGSLNSSKPKLTFTNEPDLDFTATFEDRQKPTLKITTVPGKEALTVDSFYVSGMARDNDTVANVKCQLNGSGWEDAMLLVGANNWTNWWSTVTLDAGTNILEAYAVDATGLFSKTNKLKLIYSVAPASLAEYTISYEETNTFNFGTNSFTAVDGVGTYTYKKTSSIFGRVTLNYTAPPSATGASNNATILLQFTSPTEGVFSDDAGEHDFSLTPANDLAPSGFTDSTISLVYDDHINQTDLGFYNPPSVVTNGSTVLPNPLLVPLDSDYPGQYGDRVKVLFSRQHYISQNNTWVESTQEFIGTVIDPGEGSEAVTVLFDAPPKGDKANIYALVDGEPLNILTCTYDTYESEVLVANDTATFSYTNTSPDGALLRLNQAGENQYVVMNFTNDSDTGFFYEEDYSPSNTLVAIRRGNFFIALAPQIATAPKNVSVTNGGTASFTVKATGTPTLGFQWQFKGTNLVDGATGSGSSITGSATTNLLVSVVSTNDVGSYRVIVSNTYGTVTSTAATLTISTNSTASPPTP